MEAEKSRVEVGFLEECDIPWTLESRYFPSKVGGKPAWLDLKNISIDVSCGLCSDSCIFLCQAYAPIKGQSCAYHRTIFVFVCKNPECCSVNRNSNFKVFRCQLPQINAFYSPDEPTNDLDWHPESTVEKFNSVCAVCGHLGSYQCSKCKSLKYCSRNHQVLDWKSGHNKSCEINNKSSTNILFPEYEIFIEPEDLDEEENKESEKAEKDKYKELSNILQNENVGSLQDVPCEVLENFALGKEDKYLKQFKLRLSSCPDQVLRYDRGGEPLWITKPNLNKKDIPNCEFCQGPREFEFQILSTMLRYLNVDNLGSSLDWGTLLIYTCKNNCDEGPAYKKEFLWKQDIL